MLQKHQRSEAHQVKTNVNQQFGGAPTKNNPRPFRSVAMSSFRPCLHLKHAVLKMGFTWIALNFTKDASQTISYQSSLSLGVNQKCSFLREKITRKTHVLVVTKLFVSGTQCIWSDWHFPVVLQVWWLRHRVPDPRAPRQTPAVQVARVRAGETGQGATGNVRAAREARQTRYVRPNLLHWAVVVNILTFVHLSVTSRFCCQEVEFYSSYMEGQVEIKTVRK